MYNHATELVGYAIQADRQREAAKASRLAEAERAATGQRTSGRRGSRAAIAKALMALAVRLAPHISNQHVATAP